MIHAIKIWKIFFKYLFLGVFTPGFLENQKSARNLKVSFFVVNIYL